MKNYKKLIISLALPQLAGIIGSLFTSKSIADWYQYLDKPNFSPPNWIFGPVWITLYFLMGLSSFIIWKTNTKQGKQANIIYWIHLILNTSWSILFFGLQNILAGFINIIIILFFIILIIIKFYKIKPISAYLIIPYLLWVSFATILNLSLLILN